MVLIAAYIGMVLVEHEGSTARVGAATLYLAALGFTVVAVAMMITVLTLHLLGQTIRF